MVRIILVLLMSIKVFSQTAGGGLTDIDGNTYNSVIIGSQEWSTENLEVTKFRNGDVIPEVTLNDQWLLAYGWCYYNNEESNGDLYGKLYNWEAVKDSRGLAPEGWHIPSKEEWEILMENLGGQSIAGGALKSTALWAAPNVGANNSSGFNGLPSALRHTFGDFWSNPGQIGAWWSSTPYFTDSAYFYTLNHNTSSLNAYISPAAGYSVRLIKNTSLNNNEYDRIDLSIFPNPTDDEIHVRFDNIQESIYIDLFNVFGQKVAHQEMINGSPISVKHFESGIYFLKIYDSNDNLVHTQKIIVK